MKKRQGYLCYAELCDDTKRKVKQLCDTELNDIIINLCLQRIWSLKSNYLHEQLKISDSTIYLTMPLFAFTGMDFLKIISLYKIGIHCSYSSFSVAFFLR